MLYHLLTNQTCSWDTGLIGGILTMKGFQHSFNLDPDSASYANLSGNIVSILQGGCFFGAAASFWLSDKMLVQPLDLPWDLGYCQWANSTAVVANGRLSWPTSSSSLGPSYRPAVQSTPQIWRSSMLAVSSADLASA